MKAFLPLLLILLPFLLFAEEIETPTSLSDLANLLDISGIDFEIPSTGSTDNTLKDASEGIEKLTSLLEVLEQRVHDIRNNSAVNLADAQTRSNLDKLRESIDFAKGLKDKLDGLAQKADDELKHADELAYKVIDSEENLQDSELIKNQLIQTNFPLTSDDTRHLEDSALKANVEKGQEIQGYMSTCLGAFFKNVPPSFCWKKGGDWGTIPTACPSGYFRYLAMCYKECDGGYGFTLGVCWQICPSGYTNLGLVCGKNIFKWFFKNSFIPHILTNFDSRVPCPAGMYKGLALCYRDCNKNLMVNCGIGACAQSTASCVEGILTIAMDFLAGLGEMVLFIVSFGSSSGATPALASAKTGLQAGIKKVGQSALKSAFQSFKKWIGGFTKEKVKQWLTEKVKEYVVGKIVTYAIEKACGAVGDLVFQEVQAKTEPTLTFMDQVKGLAEKIPIYGQCSKVDTNNSSPNDEIACAKNVLETVGMVDPTGLCAMAAAFMQPICDV